MQRSPGGRVLAWSYDAAEWPVGVNDGTTVYGTVVSYTAHRAIEGLRVNVENGRPLRRGKFHPADDESSWLGCTPWISETALAQIQTPSSRPNTRSVHMA